MERTVLLAAATWIGGVGAWTVGAGYVLAPRLHTYVCASFYGAAAPRMLDEQADVDVEVLPAPRPPQELSAPPTEDPADADALPGSTLADSLDLDLVRPSSELSVSSGMLTESQQRRLAPIKSLKRVRRSRKVRTIGEDQRGKYVPIVRGARTTTDETIIAAFTEEQGAKREQGEDYYVDPALLQVEIDRKADAEKRRQSFKLKKNAYSQDKLREEIAAPYKSNVIGGIVVGVGVIAVIFAVFPNLLENDVASSIASFPDSL